MKTLTSHGNMRGREATLAILEAGLQAGDPYNNTRRLIRLEKGRLLVGASEFESRNSPKTGDEIFDLSRVRNIYVFGAGKGIQRVAKAIEDALGDRLTGGHIIDKKGHPVILSKIGVTLGAHPVPDEDCVRGCRQILEMTENLNENDLVFTCVGSGVSSLLTMPVPGVSLEDVRQTTYIMQVERGAPTRDLNPIRNHLDILKGGKISRHIHPARAIHLIADDPSTHEKLMNTNLYLHTLPDCTSYESAIANLKKWQAWDAVPESVRSFLEKTDPAYETVKAPEFENMQARIFGLMPGFRKTAKLPPAMAKARELGFHPVILADSLTQVEAVQAGRYIAAITRTIERIGQPVAPPCVLFGSGEMIVTVGKETGIGGRNQEFTLSAAQGIAGSKNIVIASVDTDGTDGPGTQFVKDAGDLPCLAGGIVDGYTVEEAKRAGVDISEEIKRHNSTPAVLELDSGIQAVPNIGMLDFTVVLVMGRGQ
jgi:glycerate-2-kinase